MQLRERIGRLQSGAPPTSVDLRIAGEATGQAALHAVQARQDAVSAYRRAADAPRAAAVAMEAVGVLDRAAWHRERAAADDRAGEAELFGC
jgi:hypothetical protein